MFKTLVSALVPVAVVAVGGRGDKSAADKANANVLDGINPGNDGSKLVQYTNYWNEVGIDQHTPYLHGESVLNVVAGTAKPHFQYGFCMQIDSAEKTWDCQIVQANVEASDDGAKNTNADQFEIFDWQYKGDIKSAPVLKAAALVAGSTEDASQDWEIDTANSYTQCKKDEDGLVTCPTDGIVVAW